LDRLSNVEQDRKEKRHAKKHVPGENERNC